MVTAGDGVAVAAAVADDAGAASDVAYQEALVNCYP